MDSSDFHRKIMNLRSPNDETGDYKKGHRDARHAAAEIANDADARIAELEAALEEIRDYASWQALKKSKRMLEE